MGDNIIEGNAIFMLSLKFLTMGLCYILSPFIAPIGLIVLYFLQRKNIKIEQEKLNNTL